MKLEYILIPTLGRIDKQFTYNQLPEKWKQITYFVVQSHEFELMDSKYPGKVIRLPDNIIDISHTREFIFNMFKDNIFYVLDDDLKFRTKILNSQNKFNSKSFNDNDFDYVFDYLILNSIKEGYNFGGLQASTIISDPKYYPYKINSRIMANVFYNGPKIPRDLQWNRCGYSEDLDINMQLLSRGFKNIVFTDYVINPKNIGVNTKGGCFLMRNIDNHNDSQLELKQLWSKYVTVKEKKVKNGIWKDQIKLNVIVYFKKLYKDYENKI